MHFLLASISLWKGLSNEAAQWFACSKDLILAFFVYLSHSERTPKAVQI
jgi:hypothetical protein